MENVDGEMIRARIHAIPNDVCRKICTGQVIITLAGACKELIDNSLDAQAKTIEIRVKKMGFERVEVIDDGLGKPHSTSKLTNFSDFNQLATFGFRGEALNSLCAFLAIFFIRFERTSSFCLFHLSQYHSLSITTRHADEIMATELQFDHDGFIKSRKKCARPIGTTISINNLFETLPVRRKEFERTSKKAFTKLLNVVQSFALSQTDVRFVVNSLMDGKHHQALVTPGGNASIKDIIVNLFGARFEKGAILDIIQQEPDEAICALHGISEHAKFDDIRFEHDKASYYRITGYVSSCVHGQGRSTADRQFIYFNKRPVDYAKLCRIANEIYQQYNRGQYCMLILFVDVPPESIDVNVSPDKRSVFFEREKELFALLRASLLATFAPHLGHVGTLNRCTNPNDLPHLESMNDSFIHLSQLNGGNNDSSVISTPSFHSSVESKSTTQPRITTFAKDKSRGPSIDLADVKEVAEKTRKRPTLSDCSEKSASVQKRPAANLFERFAFKVIPHNSKEVAADSYTISEEVSHASCSIVDQKDNVDFRETSLRTVVAGASKDENIMVVPQDDANFPNLSEDDDDDDDVLVTTVKNDHDRKSNEKTENSCSTARRTQQTISFSMSDLNNRMNKLKVPKVVSNISDGDERVIESRTEFHVDNPEIAERELAAYISKKDFESMEILGQFNKGFIIVRLNNDLFIIDQHASDEKYNFERFQKKARIQTQRLISPRVLDLGVVKEAILRDNVDIFSYNGFEFRFDDEELVGKRALLTAVPVLQNWQFSISDIDEMLSVLCDFPGMMYRPAKLRKLFASRACRKSVMIGSVLTMAQMEKIVRHLGTLDHPWQFPIQLPEFEECTLYPQHIRKIIT
uniref:DNA_mis_repair domain-containing protein n=1 Tax=Elaeophora elaphi TaxID=1147741 RepID=A0A158Q6Z9_9BILA